MNWKGQTREEKEAQVTGFSITHGHVGYLHEAYHGSPYATKLLVPEAFNTETYAADIPARVMRNRLPIVLAAAEERERVIYGGDDDGVKESQKAFIDFVELAELKEAETGTPVTVMASF
jgi:hypothetical protein